MDDYGGDTLEGRLRLIERIFANIRRKVGEDFPVGVRFLADEFIKDGYTVNDAKLIGLRLAQLGAAYLSLSVGGKFEDAIHTPGQVPYPYTGYSGDRCMPGDWYPAVPHAHFSAEIKAFIRAHGFATPVATAGKISSPDDAERLVATGAVDIVGIARGLLADPDWPNKVRRGEVDRIVKCDYCNVCKHLDGTHSRVICALWPQGSLQAPPDDRASDAPRWSADGANLTATLGKGLAVLKWNKAAGAARYDVCRTDPLGHVEIADAVKVTRWEDHGLLAGMPYRYHVCAYGAAGQGGATSNTVTVSLPRPDLAGARVTACARYNASAKATIFRRWSGSGNGPRIAPRLSVMCAALAVPGMTAVTRGSLSRYFRKNCAQLPAKPRAQSGMSLPCTARNSRARPNGSAVRTAALTSAASGKMRFSARRLSSE